MNRALARHYWRIVLFSSFSAKNWLKTITGKVEYGSIIKAMMGFRIGRLFEHKREASNGENNILEDLHLSAKRGVHFFHIYSEGDEGLDYFKLMLGGEIKNWSSNRQLRVEIIKGANHLFTMRWSQEHLIKIVHNWVKRVIQD